MIRVYVSEMLDYRWVDEGVQDPRRLRISIKTEQSSGPIVIRGSIVYLKEPARLTGW